VTIISEKLKSDPFGGEVFAFCNKNRDIITAVTWKGTMFNTVSFSKLNGTFIWPCEKIGTSIEVTANEFEYLISSRKQDRYFAENS
jgi:hypothetical protein